MGVFLRNGQMHLVELRLCIWTQVSRYRCQAVHPRGYSAEVLEVFFESVHDKGSQPYLDLITGLMGMFKLCGLHL